MTDKESESRRTTNSKPIPHIPLPFKEVIADVLKVKPLEKAKKAQKRKGLTNNGSSPSK